MLEITLSAKKHYLFLWWWSWGAGGWWGYLAGWAKIPTWKLWPPYGLMVLLMRRSRMDWYRKVALAEMQTLNLKKSKTNSYLTFCQVYFKGLFGCSFFCWASFVVLLICFFQLIQGGFFNWSARFSVPKWKTSCSQPGLVFHEIFIVKKLLIGWAGFFHFGTENRADQLKKPPCICLII